MEMDREREREREGERERARARESSSQRMHFYTGFPPAKITTKNLHYSSYGQIAL